MALAKVWPLLTPIGHDRACRLVEGDEKMTQFLLSVWPDGEYPTPEPEAMELGPVEVRPFQDAPA